MKIFYRIVCSVILLFIYKITICQDKMPRTLEHEFYIYNCSGIEDTYEVIVEGRKIIGINKFEKIEHILPNIKPPFKLILEFGIYDIRVYSNMGKESICCELRNCTMEGTQYGSVSTENDKNVVINVNGLNGSSMKDLIE